MACSAVIMGRFQDCRDVVRHAVMVRNVDVPDGSCRVDGRWVGVGQCGSVWVSVGNGNGGQWCGADGPCD
jgi:hypothetical protein